MNIHPIWYICIFLRLGQIQVIRNLYLKKIKLNKQNFKMIPVIIMMMGLGFLYKAITGSNNETQITKVFWHTSRIYHSILYITASIALFFDKVQIGSILLLLDVILSISYRIIINQ